MVNPHIVVTDSLKYELNQEQHSIERLEFSEMLMKVVIVLA